MFYEEDVRNEVEEFREYLSYRGIKYARIKKTSHPHHLNCGYQLFSHLDNLPKIQALLMFLHHRFKC